MNILIWAGMAFDLINWMKNDTPDSKEAKPMEVSQVYFALPDDAVAALWKVIGSSESNERKIGSIKGVLCDGKTPRYVVKYTTLYSDPITTGMPNDRAKKYRENYQLDFRDYMKNKMLYESAGGNYDFVFYENGGLDRAQELRKIGRPFVDMKLLLSLFTYHLDRVSLRESGVEQIQYMGFDPQTGEFSEEQAIGNADMLWKWSLNKDTEVSQDGQRYTLVWTMKKFCAYAVPLTDLVSR